jgi:hypothetical protein
MGIFMLFPILLWGLFWISILGGGGYLLLRAVRALEQRSGGGASGALADRVRTLEDALLRMEQQVDELAEAQRFNTRLLSERTGGSAPEGGGGAPNASGTSGVRGALPPEPPQPADDVAP